MANSFKSGQAVKWNWGSGTAEGKVKEKFERRVQRTIKGSKVVKNGTQDNPAYLIEQEDGGKVLKRGSELHAG
jgi:DNA replication initiation complex subunit (GINS family)